MSANTISTEERQLLQAAQEYDFPTIEKLLADGININVKDKDGMTPLLLAAKKGHHETVSLLFEKGAIVDTKDKYSLILLYWAVQYGHIAIAASLIQSNKALVNLPNRDGKTALHEAALHGHKDIVSLLIANGAIIDAKDNDDTTPLHMAAYRGHNDIVKLLVKSNADVNAQTKKEKDAPLHLAAQNGHNTTIELLIKLKAPVDSRNAYLMTPLHRAAQGGHKEAVDSLTQHGADVNGKDYTNNTALHFAADHRNDKKYTLVAKRLIEKGAKASINTQDCCGDTPLHEVVARHAPNIDMMNLFLENGADVSLKNSRGETAAEIARRYGHTAASETISSYRKVPTNSASSSTPVVKQSESPFALLSSPRKAEPISVMALDQQLNSDKRENDHTSLAM